MEKCLFFAESGLDTIQITLDGLEDTHNNTRISKNGSPSYKTIINNIDQALKLLPNTLITIRVNIDNQNKQEYPALRNEIRERWGDSKKLNVYFSFINNYTSCNSPCLSSKEKIHFVTELYGKHKILTRGIFLENNPVIYSANTLGSFVIAPDGGLYKCWVDISKEDKFNDEKCLKCFIFPICSGFCPNQRFTSVFTDIKDKCPYEHENMDIVLEMLYGIMCKVKQRKTAQTNS